MYLLDRTFRNVTNAQPVIDIATTGDANWPVWDRYVTLYGKRAYYIGNRCGTCPYMFQRRKNAEKLVDLPRLTDRLGAGLTSLDPGVVDAFTSILPSAAYHIALVEISPRQVFPGSADDYFAQEQVANEGDQCIDRRWGLPHNPRVAYYRPAGRARLPVKGDDLLFEFVVPMVPVTKLNDERLRHYVAALSHGAKPTAVSLGILDIKGPAEHGVGHWCLAHFLLDGHHKLHAAALEGRPLTLVTFIGVGLGVSSASDVETVLSAAV